MVFLLLKARNDLEAALLAYFTVGLAPEGRLRLRFALLAMERVFYSWKVYFNSLVDLTCLFLHKLLLRMLQFTRFRYVFRGNREESVNVPLFCLLPSFFEIL